MIHRSGRLAENHPELVHVAPLVRRTADGERRTFHCYRRSGDRTELLSAPYGDFPRPDRTETTRPRPRLQLELPARTGGG